VVISISSESLLVNVCRLAIEIWGVGYGGTKVGGGKFSG
jgi:hypothetical protein